MDPYEPEMDESVFYNTADWIEFYGNLHEEESPGMPEPLGVPVSST